MRPQPLLVVNADDLGLTEGVCRAIARAHRDGVVTSTSVLAVGRAFDTAMAVAGDSGHLGLGAHLAIVGEDPPLLSAREIPTLVDRRGRFPLTYAQVLARAAAGRLDPADIEREFRTQLSRVLDGGVPVTHVDTHQHLHLWPAIGKIAVSLASRTGVPCVRVPMTHRRWWPGGPGVRLLSRLLRRQVTAAGLCATADFAGLDEAGHLDAMALQGALAARRSAGAPSVEINVHPGEAGDCDLGRFAWKYRWSEELAAVTDPAVRTRIADLGYRLGTFADLARGV